MAMVKALVVVVREQEDCDECAGLRVQGCCGAGNPAEDRRRRLGRVLRRAVMVRGISWFAMPLR